MPASGRWWYCWDRWGVDSPRQTTLQPPSLSLTQLLSAPTDTSFGTPPGYGCAADRAEEQRRHQDGLPYIDDSPSSSPHLSSKGRGSRDALAPGALESTKAVSPRQQARCEMGLGLSSRPAVLVPKTPQSAATLLRASLRLSDGAAKVGCGAPKAPFSFLRLGHGDHLLGAWTCQLSGEEAGSFS